VLRRVTVVEALEFPCPPARVLPAVWDLKNVEHCEVKADAVTVHPRSPRSGSYDVRGHFARVPWHGRFEYELTDAGFHSRTADVAPDDATVEGGFVVTPLGADQCTVIHYEQYVLAPWLAPLARLVRAYLHRSMRRELRDLRRLVLRDASGPAAGQPSSSSMRASHRPGASSSGRVGTMRGASHSRFSPSGPARSTTPAQNEAPIS
jgi:hypothetical protein